MHPQGTSPDDQPDQEDNETAQSSQPFQTPDYLQPADYSAPAPDLLPLFPHQLQYGVPPSYPPFPSLPLGSYESEYAASFSAHPGFDFAALGLSSSASTGPSYPTAAGYSHLLPPTSPAAQAHAPPPSTHRRLLQRSASYPVAHSEAHPGYPSAGDSSSANYGSRLISIVPSEGTYAQGGSRYPEISLGAASTSQVQLDSRPETPDLHHGESIGPSDDRGQEGRKPPKVSRCDVCFKEFPRPSALRTHQNTHTKARPYSCDFPGCQKTFNVLSNARRHMKTHVQRPPPGYEPEGAGEAVASASQSDYRVSFDVVQLAPPPPPTVSAAAPPGRDDGSYRSVRWVAPNQATRGRRPGRGSSRGGKRTASSSSTRGPGGKDGREEDFDDLPRSD